MKIKFFLIKLLVTNIVLFLSIGTAYSGGPSFIRSGQNFSSSINNNDKCTFATNDVCADITSEKIHRDRAALVAQKLFTIFLKNFAYNSVAANDQDENNLAASADVSSYAPDNFWISNSITQISDDGGPQADTDIYQMVAGVDKLIGDFVYGAALTYAHTEDEQVKIHSTGEVISILPYFAYKVNDFMFVSSLLGYSYTSTNSVDNISNLDINEFNIETNLNFFKVIDSIDLRGRTGFRYKHIHTLLEKDFRGRDDDFDELTWIADIEFGHRFSDQIRIYTGFLYEYTDREASAASSLVHDGVGYMRYGAEYSLNKSLTFDTKIQHDINDEDNDYFNGSVNLRFVF